MVEELITILIVVIFIIVIAVIVWAVFCLNRKNYEGFLFENSLCLEKLKEINSRYQFNPYINFDQSHEYDNENMYNTISCTDYLIYQLQFNRKKILEQIEKIRVNNTLYSQYIEEIKSIKQTGEYKLPIGDLNPEKLMEKEKMLIEKQTMHSPSLKFALSVTLYCSTLDGRTYAKKSERFSAETIKALVRRLNNKTGDFFNDRAIWDSISRVERGKVSNKMRFAVYSRDGYKCRKCGISDKYAPLEIDHIIPIAKGGKSTFNNLQTLCHKCNVEKGDRIIF